VIEAGSPPGSSMTLGWEGGTVLACRAGDVSMTLDWDTGTAASPVQALVFALAGCMASDVVVVLEKGRQPLRGLSATVRADRAGTPPRRLLRVDIRFAVEGEIPPAKVERAIRLSRETYCSVWHSMAQDIDLRTSFEFQPPA
jgi:putative redox protein